MATMIFDNSDHEGSCKTWEWASGGSEAPDGSVESREKVGNGIPELMRSLNSK